MNMDGGNVCNGGRSQASNLSLLFHNQTAPCASEPLDTLFLSGPSCSSLGSRSMVSFSDVQMKRVYSESFFGPFDHEGSRRDDDFDEYFHQPEKKKRLTNDQVQFLEQSFEVENKLEPERKIQLAKDLGLQPRQVAIWFQNRRARWKTKQLEKDYDVLQASYNSLKADYESLLKEKDNLNDEFLEMTEKLLKREREGNQTKQMDTRKSEGSPEGEGSKVSAKSDGDIFDSDSPHCKDGVHSSLLEPGYSPHVYETDQSDLSQDEDDNLRKDLFPVPPYVFPKLEDVDYNRPPESSCFTVEDHAIWSWSF